MVTDIQVNSPNETTLVISWEPPANPNGNINGYTVRIINMRESSIVTQDMVSMQRFSETGLGNAEHIEVSGLYSEIFVLQLLESPTK